MPDSAATTPPLGPKSDLAEAALQYHEFPTPGKLSVVAKKPLANQRDLALAYSPGVAAACLELTLEGLWLTRRIDKDATGSTVTYGGV